ncbi:hypothetical protein ABI_09390 [Asticcacaulis biprosthecium C19]|uniref:Lipoprotein n=1 Tax=Asticcacaulis biprosthecium C19 TaxID=715226 RepID=F4QGQ0_9CAUL|nr:hypothetical protein [Asticcacaulis biprosthecium]EGF92502.1 hypothetical protein ABI_09390 [Asticcacaulis biprosthecium C19]
MKSITGFAAAMGLLALTGCGDSDADKPKGKPWTGAPLPVHEITIELDDSAMRALTEANDKLRVTTIYYGLPTAQSAAKANDRHELEMGSHTYVVDRSTKRIKVTGEGVDVTLLADTADGQIQFKTNAIGVTQANFYHDIIDCSIARGVLTKPQPAPKVMTCSLKKP